MRKYLFMLLLLSFAFSCKKEEEVNVYETVINDPNSNNPNHIVPDPASIAGLHQNIFAPTCANSGCHDGTFEPDFRTIESTYNTLVLRPIIKNDPAGTYTYRVVPGDYQNSVLYQRLILDIDGQSGIMPLVTEPNSDWSSKSATYIENVKNWIQNGAKDVFGNAPVQSNLPPQLSGMFIAPVGSTSPFPRNIQTGAIEIPVGTASVDVWLAFSDDQTAVDQLTYLKAKVGASMNEFAGLSEIDLTAVNPHSETGYSGNPVIYRHKFTFALSGISTVQPWFVRAYVQDNGPAVTEIPSTGSAEYIKRYYSFQVGE
jgi:hypothetical protein